MTTGENAQLEAIITPSDATEQGVSWSSDNTDIVTVSSQGRVRALKAGSATITAASRDSGTVSATCAIKVEDPVLTPVGNIELNKWTLELTVGDVDTSLVAAVLPANAADKTLVWESSNEHIVSVKERWDATAQITALRAGTATIRVMSRTDHTKFDECEVTVKPKSAGGGGSTNPDELYLDPNSIKVDKGQTRQVSARGSVIDAGSYSIAWSSEDDTVATVASGHVRGVSPGSTTIWATVTQGGVERKASCTVEVTSNVTIDVYPSSIRFDRGTKAQPLEVITSDDSKAKVTWTVEDGKIISWKSDDDNDMRIQLSQLAPGETKLTAKIDGAAPAECTVTVSGVRLIRADRESMDSDNPAPLQSGSVMVGRTLELSYKQFGAAVGAGTAVWESSDNSVASVSAGRVTGRGVGKARITATVGDYVSQVCEVTVTENTVGALDAGSVTAGSRFDFSSIRDQLNRICRETVESGTGLDYITNLTVPTGQGVLYYNYVSASDTGSGVGSEKYYYSDTVLGGSRLSDVTFVPRTDYSGTATISYSGYSAERESFSGTIKIRVNELRDVTYETKEDTPLTFQASEFNNICRGNTGRELSYVTFELPDSNRGTLYYNYTGQEVYPERASSSTQYYRTRAPYLDQVTFVPAEGWTGTVRITYRGVDTSGTAYSGRVAITVTGGNEAGDGDVKYTADPGRRTKFRAADFNSACRDAIGESLEYVRFELPSSSRGTLYYNYSSSSSPGSRVSESTRYYRTGSPSISNITFVPASSSLDRVAISFTAYGVDGGRYSGDVVIWYDGAAEGDFVIPYDTRSGRAVEFVTADFNEVSQDATGRNLDYVRFDDLPSSSRGTLYYNYRSSSDPGSRVTASTRLYRSGSPSLSRVAFLPASGYSGTVSIGFTGRDVDGSTFEGVVRIEVNEGEQTIRYSVFSGRSVLFEAADFNTASQDATGSNLSYVRFDLPSSSRGTLYYKYSQSGSARVNESTSYYRSGSGRLLDDVSFVAASAYAGTVEIPYTGNSTSGERFTGRVQIQVTSPTVGSIRYSGSSLPIQFRASDFRLACSQVLSRELSYIQFTGLPGDTAGRLYLNYSGIGTGTRVSTGTYYYASGSPNLDQIRFVARAGYQGSFSIPYTAVDTGGERVTGSLQITISNSGSSRFSDMGSHSWAVPAVEFLSQNGVVSGIGSDRYGPEESIQRCDFVLMLCNAFKLDTGATSSFPDVPAGSYYARAVATARELGITAGTNGRFMPGSSLSRQDALVMLRQAMIAAGRSVPSASFSSLSSYRDSGQVAEYARSAVASMVQLGVISGDSGGRLNPTGAITRAEMAVVLHQVLTLQ